ncbi:MAG: flavin reductase family protein [Actinomycetota bacterium]|nr:flavin reductase family protein [Actinomycetota bacterium]
MSPHRLEYRSIIGRFATGVAVITGTGPDGAVGMTTNALTSLSLEPLLLLVCFDNTARTLPIVRDTGRFGVNILRAHHHELSGVFASKLAGERKFEAVEYSTDHGVPVLADALAWLVCDLRELLSGGDHTIGVGEVVAMGEDARGGAPLVWYRGGYTTVAGAEAEESPGAP